MELTLKRIALRDTYTIGKLYVDGVYVCDTLEDKVRDLNKDGDLNDAGEGKVYGKTAIPYGRYEITMKVQSPKYSQRASYAWCKGYLPRLLNVPHFEGILIHGGNSAEDSCGCLLVGENKVKGKVINSMATLKRLVSILKYASDNNEKIWITIE
jgi:hypothetical protein